MTSIILFGSLFLLILLSVPVGISIGLSTLFTLVFATDLDVSTMAQRTFTSLDSFPLLAIPFFMLTGLLMGKGGVARRLIDLAGTLVGWMVGGLAMITVLGCMFFAAISGSGPATVAAIGSFMIPEMRAKNYGAGFASAITAAAGSIGVLIPPSIPLVLFGVVGSVSIGSLFMAGILPGIVVGISLMVISYILMKRNKDIEPPEIKTVSIRSVLKALNEAKWALIAPIIILGGIYGGIVTPTESAVVAIVYSLFVGIFIHKELKWKEIKECFVETISITGISLYMVGLSATFAYLLTIERIPQSLAETLTTISENPIVILLIINAFLLVVGAFIDTIAAIVILTPILLPVAAQIGVDPIHFGVIMIANLAIGFVTPPVGANLFVASAIGKVSLEKLSRSMVPIFVALIVALMVITYIPELSTFIPSLSD
jgi:C4-dicarboxylate transporter DctM subunit